MFAPKEFPGFTVTQFGEITASLITGTTHRGTYETMLTNILAPYALIVKCNEKPYHFLCQSVGRKPAVSHSVERNSSATTYLYWRCQGHTTLTLTLAIYTNTNGSVRYEWSATRNLFRSTVIPMHSG